MRYLAPIVILLAAAGCAPDAPAERPNVLWIVWDTVRADHLSLYGHERATTPFLDAWAKNARVFEDCVSPAGSTVPSHASMFTGLFPTEHGSYHTQRTLNESHDTVAELLSASGYATYLFAANPHIQSTLNFTQGFDLAEHPWSERWRDEAIRIVHAKAEGDGTTRLPDKLAVGDYRDWNIIAAGDLARQGLLDWLGGVDDDRPWFAFLNYMEAHMPLLPPRELRERFMTPEQVEHSYTGMDNRSALRWAFCFREHEYSAEDLDVLARVYDAAILELDMLLERLLGDLEEHGALDDTIVVLVGDHGEHLGEHHMLDHQYALYQPLLHVPLVVHAPGRLAAGRDSNPVMSLDLFPTLLGLTGVELPQDRPTQAVSLLDASPDRVRLAEYPVVFKSGLRQVQRLKPDWDPEPWKRRMRALYRDGRKLICSTDGKHELFDLDVDPGELDNLFSESADPSLEELVEVVNGLTRPTSPGQVPEYSATECEMLIQLGYLDSCGELDSVEEAPPAGFCGF